MPRALTCLVQVRQCGEPWRTLWKGGPESVALASALTLASAKYTVSTDIVIDKYPYVRVKQGKTILLDVTPQSRQKGAAA